MAIEHPSSLAKCAINRSTSLLIPVPLLQQPTAGFSMLSLRAARSISMGLPRRPPRASQQLAVRCSSGSAASGGEEEPAQSSDTVYKGFARQQPAKQQPKASAADALQNTLAGEFGRRRQAGAREQAKNLSAALSAPLEALCPGGVIHGAAICMAQCHDRPPQAHATAAATPSVRPRSRSVPAAAPAGISANVGRVPQGNNVILDTTNDEDKWRELDMQVRAADGQA